MKNKRDMKCPPRTGDGNKKPDNVEGRKSIAAAEANLKHKGVI